MFAPFVGIGGGDSPRLSSERGRAPSALRLFDQIAQIPKRQRIRAYPFSSSCAFANSRTALPIRFHSDIGRGLGFLLKA